MSSFDNVYSDFNLSQVNQIAESETYEDLVIGTSPNESSVNDFSQDVALLSQSSSYSSANMINYDLSSGTTSFENFNSDSYQMRNSTNVDTHILESSYSTISSMKDDSILVSEGYLPDDAGYSLALTSIF